MNVGLLDTLSPRYLRFWAPFMEHLQVDVLRPQLPKDEAYQLGRESLPDEPTYVQLALGRILEFHRADAVLVPPLPELPGDPWTEAFTDVLARRVSSLPNLVTVPEGGADAARAASEIGNRLTRNPGLVRRALDRNRLQLNPPRESMPDLSAPSRRTVAVIGPEVLLAEPYLLGALPAQLDELQLHPVYSHQLPRDVVLERGLRAGAASPGARELAGAQGALEGKSAVKGLLFVVPARSGAYVMMARKLAQKAHTTSLVLEVSPEREDWSELEAFARQVQFGTAHIGHGAQKADGGEEA